MREFSAVLAAHAARYPRMEARDWAKLAYQSQFGPAHLLDRDPAALQADSPFAPFHVLVCCSRRLHASLSVVPPEFVPGWYALHSR